MLTPEQQATARNFSYAKEMANSLVATGEIPLGQPVSLVPFAMDDREWAFKRRATARKAARQATVLIPHLEREESGIFDGTILYMPHGKGVR